MDPGQSAAPPAGEEEGGWRPPPPPDPPAGRRRLYREPEDKKLAGICGGLADYTGVDPALVRAGAILLIVVTPLTVIAYLAAIFAIDERPASVPRVVAPPVEALERHRWVPLVVIAGAVLVGAGGPWWWWPSFDVPLTAPLLIGVGVWLLVRSREPEPPGRGPGAFAGSTEQPQSVAEPRSQKSWSSGQEPTNLSLGVDITTRNDESGRTVDRPADLRDAAEDPAEAAGLAQRTGSPPADEGAGPPGELPPLTPPEWSGPEPVPGPPPGRGSEHLGLAVTALVLIGGGTVWFLRTADIAELDLRKALAVGLVAMGLGLVLAAWRGRARAALIPLGLVAIGALVTGEVVKVPLDAGIGERTVIATRRGQVDEPIELLIGELTVDLRDLPLDRRRTTEVEAGVGLGEMHVIVPRHAEVAVDAHLQAGEVAGALAAESGNDGDSGAPVEGSYLLDGPRGAPRLDVTLDVGIGRIEVVRG